MIEMLDHSWQVAHSVTVRVGEAAWVDLVDHPPPPVVISHHDRPAYGPVTRAQNGRTRALLRTAAARPGSAARPPAAAAKPRGSHHESRRQRRGGSSAVSQLHLSTAGIGLRVSEFC